MTRELMIKIEDAEFQRDSALEIEDAIMSLSKSQMAVGALLTAYRDAIINAEEQWREIESRADFRAQYRSREDCRIDFLKQCFGRDK